jgi:hypothetical protein
VVFRTRISVLCVTLTALSGGVSADEPGKLGDFHIQPTSWLDDAAPPQNDDVQFQSDLPGPSGDEIGKNGEELPLPSVDHPLSLETPKDEVVHSGYSGSLDSGGFMFNGHHPKTHFNGPVTYPDRDEGQLDQLYSAGGFNIGGEEGWYFATRYDLLFGSDFIFTTSAGLDGTTRGNRPRWYGGDSLSYGWAMPQLFIEFGNDEFGVKLGHFFSPIGYEAVPAQGNFFVTHSYAFQYGEPTTQTGVLVSNSLNECWSWTGGIVGGWNTFDADTRAAFVGGVTYKTPEYGSIGFTLVTGDDSTSNEPGVGPFANRTMFSVVTVENLSSRLTSVWQYDLGVQQDADTLQGTDHAEWYGITNYLYYRLSDCWTAGGRLEWFRDDDGFSVTGLRPHNPLVGQYFAGDFYETSLGLNYAPSEHVTIRPEVRYDWFSADSRSFGSQNPFDDDTRKEQILYGVDAVLHY